MLFRWRRSLIGRLPTSAFQTYKLLAIISRVAEHQRAISLKKVITYGTFDTLHYGHISLLKRARALGDFLIVGLSTDAFNATKKKQSHFTFAERKMYLEAIRYVDMVIPENSWEQKPEDIAAHQINIFTMGHDWAGQFEDLTTYCEVRYLERTPEISSTMIKANIIAPSQKPADP